MLLAACADFASVPGCEVHTTWDARLGAFPLNQVGVVIVHNANEEHAAFDRCAEQSDATFVIAPEFEGLLARKCARVEELGGKLLGSSIAAIELCADKLRLFSHLHEHGLPTIPTRIWSHPEESPPLEYPFVIKPRDGAGSMHTFLVTNSRELEAVRKVYAELPSGWQGIAQPYVVGNARSVGALIAEYPRRIEIFPPAEQFLSNDGRFRYLGGRINGSARLNDTQAALILQACESIPGLSGYVGIDYLVSNDAPDDLLIVEINPRLTTSYLGYRAACDENLPARCFNGAVHDTPICWSTRTVTFTPDNDSKCC